jgi:hypothetical protein
MRSVVYPLLNRPAQRDRTINVGGDQHATRMRGLSDCQNLGVREHERDSSVQDLYGVRFQLGEFREVLQAQADLTRLARFRHVIASLCAEAIGDTLKYMP